MLRLKLSGSRDRIDLVGIEGEQFLDREHLVVRLLVGPDGVLRAVLQRVVRRLALEGAGGLVARADEPLHLHVLARDVVDDGRHYVADVSFLELNRIPRVGDDFAFDLDLHAHARGLGRNAMLRVLLPARTAVGAHETLLFPVGLPDSQLPHSDSTLPPHPEKCPFQKNFCATRRRLLAAWRSPGASAARPTSCSPRRRSSPSSRARAARWSKLRDSPPAAPARRRPGAGAPSSFRPSRRRASTASSRATRSRCSRRARTARPRGSTGASASIRGAIRSSSGAGASWNRSPTPTPGSPRAKTRRRAWSSASTATRAGLTSASATRLGSTRRSPARCCRTPCSCTSGRATPRSAPSLRASTPKRSR